MAKVTFKSFQEASAFSKNLAMTIKATITVRREGDSWWVDDPRAEQVTTPDNAPANDEAATLGTHSSLYDAEGYDPDGFNKNGYNKRGINSSGYDKDGIKRSNTDGVHIEYRNSYGDDRLWENKDIRKDNILKDCNIARKTQGYDRGDYDRQGYDRQGYDIDGFNKKGYGKDGYDKNGYNKRGFDKVRVHYNTKDEYDEDGYDFEGINKAGYSRLGYHRDGHHIGKPKNITADEILSNAKDYFK